LLIHEANTSNKNGKDISEICTIILIE